MEYSMQNQKNAHLFFKWAHNIYQNRPYSGLLLEFIDHKSLNKLKKILVIQYTVSDHSGIKLEINKSGKKSPNVCKLKVTLWVTEEINREIRNYFEVIEIEITRCQHVGCCERGTQLLQLPPSEMRRRRAN